MDAFDGNEKRLSARAEGSGDLERSVKTNGRNRGGEVKNGSRRSGTQGMDHRSAGYWVIGRKAKADERTALLPPRSSEVAVAGHVAGET